METSIKNVNVIRVKIYGKIKGRIRGRTHVIQFILRLCDLYFSLFYLGLSSRPNCFNLIRLHLQKNIVDNTNVERLSNAIASNGINVIFAAHVDMDVIPRTCVRVHPLNY